MRDISEFTQAVKEDASKLVASTAAQMKDQLNINVSQLFVLCLIVTFKLSELLIWKARITLKYYGLK